MFKATLVAVLVILTGCSVSCSSTDTTPPSDQPVRTAVQPMPSWMIGMEPGCFAEDVPVAGECLEGGAPKCRVADSVGPCWWRDPQGDLWFRP